MCNSYSSIGAFLGIIRIVCFAFLSSAHLINKTLKHIFLMTTGMGPNPPPQPPEKPLFCITGCIVHLHPTQHL